MKYCVIITVFLLVFSGCGTRREVVSDIRLDENKNIVRELTVYDSLRFNETVERAISAIIDERLNISVSTKKYDTDKPVDSLSGKPPLKEESDIFINKNTNTQLSDSTAKSVNIDNSRYFTDNSADNSKTRTNEKTETKTGLKDWEKLGAGIISILVLILLILFIVRFNKRLV
jgi:hypothetical protein